MTDATWAAPAPIPGAVSVELERVWPDHRKAMPRQVIVLALVAGTAGAGLLPESAPGLGLLVVGLLVAAAALPGLRGRLEPHVLAYGSLATLLLGVVVLRDAPWIVVLALLGTFGLSSYALVPGRTFVAVLLGGLSLPMAALRSLPWMSRGLHAQVATMSGRRTWWSLARAAAVSTCLLLVFGSLFVSADPAFGTLVPDADFGMLPLRIVVFVIVAGVATCVAFLSAAPPRWDRLALAPARPVRMVEWVLPIATLIGLFATFVGVQLTVLFGGQRHVLETAGLTYAAYARSGFGQLVVVTLLTLTVVAVTARHAPRSTRMQQTLLRGLLGALCLLTLVIVASALHRLHLYEDAFGFTRLRLFMNAFESWLGVLFVLVLIAGLRLRATWLPRAAVASGAVALLVLAALNPDAFVAARNVERFEATGRVDVSYLQGLSADAVPTVATLPEPLRSCVLAGMHRPEADSLAGWNLGRSRARPIFAGTTAPPTDECAAVAQG